MYEANRVRFIPWEKYISKEAELDKELKAEHLFALDSSGQLKLENKKQEPIANTSSEIMLQYALQRRGLAMDQANLLEYHLHQAWIDRLLKVRLHSAPPGYQKTTFRQLLGADKRLFEELADMTRSGVQTTTKDVLWMRFFKICCNQSEVMHLLQPLMGKTSDARPDEKKASGSSAAPRASPYASPSGGKGRGKSKSKSKSGGPKLPTILLEGGCRATTNRGDPICFGYNLGTCSLPVSDGRCEKGFHVCALPKCGKHHPFVQCPSRKGGS